MAIYFLPMFEPTNGFCWVVSISSVIDYFVLPQNEYNFFFLHFISLVFHFRQCDLMHITISHRKKYIVDKEIKRAHIHKRILSPNQLMILIDKEGKTMTKYWHEESTHKEKREKREEKENHHSCRYRTNN